MDLVFSIRFEEQGEQSEISLMHSTWISQRFRRKGLLSVVTVLGVAAILSLAQDATSPVNPVPTNTLQVFSGVHAPTRGAWQKRLTLGPGDVLSFGLFGYPDLNRSQVIVGPDGRVSYLQAMNIVATGLTVDELRAKFDEELSKFYRAPKTIIVPQAIRSKKIYLLGKVVNKGVYYLDRPLTIIEAVAQAQGLEAGFLETGTIELADLPRSFLLREGKRLPVDFERLFQQGDLSQNIFLEPDDYLYFPSTSDNAVYVLGEVRSPGPVPIMPQMSAVSAIVSRGGFSPRAYRSRILVVRGSFNQPKTFVLDTAAVLAGQVTDFKLEPKDIVYVSQRPWTKALELLDYAARAYLNAMVVTWTGENIRLIDDPLIK
jgi:protein involved in polysaccharide export with SLBB domain